MTSFQCGDELDLVVVWVVEMNLFFYAGGKSLVFSVGMPIDLIFVWVVQIDLVFVWQSKMTCFFRVWVEIDGGFMLWHRSRVDIRVGIDIDLISMVGSKFTWFLYAVSKLTWL